MARLTNGIRDGPERSFNCRKGMTLKDLMHTYGAELRTRQDALPTMISKEVPGRGWISVKDSGHREIEFGTMVRVIPALAGCREWGF